MRISWYPVRDVLNTTSPNTVPFAPNAKPGHTDPSSSTRRQSLGFQGLPSATAETAFCDARSKQCGVWRGCGVRGQSSALLKRRSSETTTRQKSDEKKSADCLPVANRRAKGGGLKGGLAEIERGAARRREPPSPRVPSTVLDRARRARVGAAAGATAVARLEERRAPRVCAGQAAPRALAAIMPCF